MADLIRTEAILIDCRAAFEGNEDSPIGSYLAQYCSVALCAEMQQRIYEIVETEVTPSANKGAPFFLHASKKILRSVKKSEIAGFIGAFGSEYKIEFNSLLEDKDREVAIYNNIVTQRHRASHDGNASLTLDDVTKALPAASLILASFRNSLQGR